MNISALLTLVRNRQLLSHTALMRDLKTLSRLYFLYAAIDMGLLMQLRKPSSLEMLSRKINAVRTDLLDLLLELGVALGELSFRNGLYALRGKRSRSLSNEYGDPFAAMLQECIAYHGSVYHNLADRIGGAPQGDYLKATATLIARSSRSLEHLIKIFVQRAIHECKPKSLLEIGCGSGIYIRHAAEMYKEVTGIGIDMQEMVIHHARENLKEWGLADRFTVVKADIRNWCDTPEKSFDFISLYNNLYYFKPEERPSLFRRIRSLITPGGTFAMVSLMRGKSITSRNFDIVLRSTSGCASLPEIGETMEHLRASGFNDVEKRDILPSEDFYGVLAW